MFWDYVRKSLVFYFHLWQVLWGNIPLAMETFGILPESDMFWILHLTMTCFEFCPFLWHFIGLYIYLGQVLGFHLYLWQELGIHHCLWQVLGFHLYLWQVLGIHLYLWQVLEFHLYLGHVLGFCPYSGHIWKLSKHFTFIYDNS